MMLSDCLSTSDENEEEEEEDEKYLGKRIMDPMMTIMMIAAFACLEEERISSVFS